MKEINSGQVWSYHSRKGESNSRVTVLAVEKDSNYGNIVHVRIDGLYITDTRGIYIGDCIEHLPIAEDSFLESVIHVEGEAHYDLGEGYYLWRSDFEQNEAGVWEIDIRKAIDLIVSSIA
ncbi:hypothetical protein [Sphingobacterium thalpophilum]|uniref:hypothetical protein n=1 Tax=Sphingobacterium thalpophilum TaxID=259 RepID=UPI0031CE212A